MTYLQKELGHESLIWAEVLAVKGELDIAAAQWFSDAIAAKLAGDLPVIVDLSGCDYLDSTILNVLIRAANAAPNRVGVVVPVSSRIRRIFNITGLEGALQLSESRDALQVRFSA
ncbi:MAG: STAS domain-containing protein [Candidatus Aquilonibacter sp.]